MLPVREENSAGVIFFRIDLDQQPSGGDPLETLPCFVPVPASGGDPRFAAFGVVGYFVDVTHEIESSGLDHPDQLVEIGGRQPPQIAAETPAQHLRKTFRRGIDIDDTAVVGVHQVDRPDPIIERKLPEVIGGRIVALVQIIDLHAGVQLDPPGIRTLKPFDFGKIGRHVAPVERPDGRERQRRVRGDAVRGESAAHGLAHEILHRCSPVAQRAMAVIVGKIACHGRPRRVRVSF